MYKLLGRVDLSKRNVPGVTQTTEDWIWFQLSLLREEEDEDEVAGHEKYGLKELGKVLRRFGEGHFSPGGKRPLLYFQVLVLSGQFELVRLSLSLSLSLSLPLSHSLTSKTDGMRVLACRLLHSCMNNNNTK